jgi:hypothetical protein
MSSTRSEKEIQDGYCSAMGQELGTVFFQLYRKLVELHIVWQQYRQLFGSEPETVQLINRTAGLFFKIVQDELWDSVLLGVSRMTDPPKTGAKENLTVQSLPAMLENSALREDVAALCKTALEDAAFAREHRNKRIAHQDRDYLIDRVSNPLSGVIRERVETMLNSLRAVLNRLDAHYRDTTVMYQDFIDESGARLLVSKLKKLERLDSPANAL